MATYDMKKVKSHGATCAHVKLRKPLACRSPYLWKDPDVFRPERFTEANSNPDFKGAWAGYRPGTEGSSMYPNEVRCSGAHVSGSE